MKFKITATIFVVMVIAISIYATLHPSYDLGLFVDLDRAIAQTRIAVATILLAYTLLPVLRLKITRIAMLLGGSFLVGLGIVSIFTPLLFGHLSHYVTPGDVIIALEGGTLSMLASLQLKTRQLKLPRALFASPYRPVELYKLKTSSQSRAA